MALLYSSPNDKILHSAKFKVFAGNKSNVAEKMTPVFDNVTNIVGKGEKYSLIPFSPFLTLFCP